MADIGNPEIKKNDATKDTSTSTAKNTDVKVDATTASSSTKPSTPIAPTPVVKMTVPQEEKYPIGDLIENSKALTGYGKEVAVGALFNCKEKELTKDEFKKTIKDFLGKKVE